MVAAIIVLGQFALRITGAPKFAAPNHEGVVKHAALFEVFDECGAGLVGFAGLDLDAGGQIVVLVPALMIKLDEADAAFGQAAGEEAVGGVGAGLAAVGTVKLEYAVGFLREIGHRGHGALHAISHFVLGDSGFDFGIEFFLELQLIERADFVEQRAASGAARAVRIGHVEDRFLARTELDALVAGVQETAPPKTGVKGLILFVGGDENDEGREIFIHRAKAVMHPRTHGWASGNLRAGLEKGDGGIVIDGLGVHRTNHAEFVSNSGGVRQQITEPRAGFSVLLKFEYRAGQRNGGILLARSCRSAAWPPRHAFGQLFTVQFVKERLVIEQVHLRRSTALKKINDALGLGGKVGEAGQAADGSFLARRRQNARAAEGWPGRRRRVRARFWRRNGGA